MWVPSGDFFVADRAQEAPRGTIMDFLVPHRHSNRGPIGYGFNRNGSINLPASRNTQRQVVHRSGPIRNHGRSLAERPVNRHDPISRPEPHPAGTGSRRTVARRERREKLRQVNRAATATTTTVATQQQQPPTPPTSQSGPTPPSPSPLTPLLTSPGQSNITTIQTPDPNVNRMAEICLTDEDDVEDEE